MFVIALTGGVGSGKSTLCQYFNAFGVRTIDTDDIAKQLVTRGSTALQEIIQNFGERILQKDGNLNRRLMRDIIFNDVQQKTKLEEILHPKIVVEVKNQIKLAPGTYCIVAIPLLVETHHLFKDIIHRTLVINTLPKLQQNRLAARDNLSIEKAQLMIQNQASIDEQLKLANDIIANNGNLDQLKAEALKLHQLYKKLSS